MATALRPVNTLNVVSMISKAHFPFLETATYVLEKTTGGADEDFEEYVYMINSCVKTVLAIA